MSDENKDHKRSTSINDLAEAAARHLPARIPLASTGNSQPKKDKILFGIDEVETIEQVLAIARSGYYHADYEVKILQGTVEAFRQESENCRFRYDALIALGKIPNFTLPNGKELELQDVRTIGINELESFLYEATIDQKLVIDGQAVDVFLQALKEAENYDDEIISAALIGLRTMITRYPDIFRPFGNETVKTIVEGFNDAANGLKPWLREIFMAAPDVLDKIYQSSTPGFADFITSDAKNIIDGKTSRQIAINKSLAATP